MSGRVGGGTTRYCTYCSTVSSTSSDVFGVTRLNRLPTDANSSACFSGKSDRAATFCCAQNRGTSDPSAAAGGLHDEGLGAGDFLAVAVVEGERCLRLEQPAGGGEAAVDRRAGRGVDVGDLVGLALDRHQSERRVADTGHHPLLVRLAEVEVGPAGLFADGPQQRGVHLLVVREGVDGDFQLVRDVRAEVAHAVGEDSRKYARPAAAAPWGSAVASTAPRFVVPS